MERDPVCGTDLGPGQGEASFTLHDRTYRFCSVECCQMFKDNSEQYIQEMQAASTTTQP